MKTRKIHTFTILIGLLLAVAIVFSHTFQSRLTCSNSGKQVKSEQKEDQSKENASYISIPSISLPSTVHIHLNLIVYCLFEILGEEETEAPKVEDSNLHPQKFFQTLFRVIISPNAP